MKLPQAVSLDKIGGLVKVITTFAAQAVGGDSLQAGAHQAGKSVVRGKIALLDLE